MLFDTRPYGWKSFLREIMPVVIVFFLLHMPVAADPLKDKKDVFPSFGTGPVDVRIYASYFCPPCRAMEPELEPIVKELVKTDTIRITFVDVPFAQAMPYIQHFLYALHEDSSLDNAFTVRHILFDTAEKYGDADDIRQAFENEGIRYTPFDPTTVFMQFNQFLREDGIRSTPSATIRINGKTNFYNGGRNILPALEDLISGKDESK
jgi:thiol-disulfide isomerase/thioredoxin